MALRQALAKWLARRSARRCLQAVARRLDRPAYLFVSAALAEAGYPMVSLCLRPLGSAQIIRHEVLEHAPAQWAADERRLLASVFRGRDSDVSSRAWRVLRHGQAFGAAALAAGGSDLDRWLLIRPGG